MNLHPCTAEITAGENGGLTVTLLVPTYEAEPARFTITAERDEDGWRVHLPWFSHLDAQGLGEMQAGYEVANGIVYLGAPDD